MLSYLSFGFLPKSLFALRPRLALIAQLDRALASGAKGRRFKSYWVHHKKTHPAVWRGGFFCGAAEQRGQ